jgi:hypothetical protein
LGTSGKLASISSVSFDLTNLVYSFGLSLAAVFLTGSIGAFVFRSSSSLPRIVAWVAVGGTLSMWGIIHFSPRTLDPELAANGAILIGFIVSSAAFFGLVRLRQQGSAKWDWRNLAALVFCLTAATFQAGAFTAALELSDRFTYSISTKSGVIENVRIMRSSSAGFLVVLDGRIMFVPQGEVHGVESSPRK